MTLVREFNLYLTAGRTIPLVINVNQFDSGEQWVFTLYKEDGTQYIPSTGAIVGIKSDGYLIANAGTVDEQGRVVITETQQMTAAAGKAIFELQIDNETHGTANFIVLVEPDPSNNGIASGSDIGLLRDALNGGLSQAAIDALLACFENVAWDDDDPTGHTYIDALEAALNAVRGIYLDVSTLSFVGSGQTQQLTATTVPAGGTVSWESSNTSVATVSSSGLVTSAGVGTATITATSGDVSATCTVTVTEAPLTALYSWDLTASLTDTVEGVVATTSATFTQGTGVVFEADNKYLDFGVVYDVDRTYEIDVASIGPHTTAPNTIYRRLFMVDVDVDTSSGGAGLIYGHSGAHTGWWTYLGSSWDSTALNSGNYSLVNGKTIRIYVDSSSKLHVYTKNIGADDSTYESFGVSAGALESFTNGHVYCGSSDRDYLDPITISGFRVYEGEV